MKSRKPKNVLDVLRHDDVFNALKGKTACACGCASVYRRVTGTGIQTFSFTGVLVSKEYDFQADAELRCQECDALIATA